MNGLTSVHLQKDSYSFCEMICIIKLIKETLYSITLLVLFIFYISTAIERDRLLLKYTRNTETFLRIFIYSFFANIKISVC